MQANGKDGGKSKRSMALVIAVEKLRNKFWLIPAALVVAMIVLLAVLINIPDFEPTHWAAKFFLHGYSREGARLISSSIATSFVTVIGVLFSLTIVILQQVSNQYSPRVIESFVKSYVSQVTLGMFVGTFVYCLLLLRQIPESVGSDQGELPQIAITVSLILALICTGLLVHYIHHIANSIKSTNVIKSLRDETIYYLEELSSFLSGLRCQSLPPLSDGEKMVIEVRSCNDGYLKAVDFDELDSMLREAHASIRMQVLPGDFVNTGDKLATIELSKGSAHIATKDFNSAFDIGSSRTHAQDFRFGIRQLADIALRALSPGINDPSTAIESVNTVGSVLISYSRDSSFPNVFKLKNGTVVAAEFTSGPELVELGFSQIIMSSEDHPTVLLRVKELLSKIRDVANCEELVARCADLIHSCDLRLIRSQNKDLFHKVSDLSREFALRHRWESEEVPT